mgnify:CR=1 FL=1
MGGKKLALMMILPFSVNFSEFLTRLINTCLKRRSSPFRRAGSGQNCFLTGISVAVRSGKMFSNSSIDYGFLVQGSWLGAGSQATVFSSTLTPFFSALFLKISQTELRA